MQEEEAELYAMLEEELWQDLAAEGALHRICTRMPQLPASHTHLSTTVRFGLYCASMA